MDLKIVDLCAQIRSTGKGLAVIPESVVFHLTSQTAGRFSCEKENALVLLRRCWGKFIPDTHKFYVEDGYDFKLTYNLLPYPVLSKSRQEELERLRSKEFDIAWYMEMIFREPLWKDGYVKLYEFFLQKEMREQAQEIYSRAVKIFPPEEIYLMHNRSNCMNEELVQAVRNLGEILKNDMAEKKKELFTVAKMIRKYAEENDQLLYAAIKEWGKQYRVKI